MATEFPEWYQGELNKQTGYEAKSLVLRSCPFCGGNDLHLFEKPSIDTTITWYKIVHSATNPCSVSMMDSNRENLIEMWNARP